MMIKRHLATALEEVIDDLSNIEGKLAEMLADGPDGRRMAIAKTDAEKLRVWLEYCRDNASTKWETVQS